eukprot:7929065-Lingulodinium_polyedra.AAC.1
MDLATNVFIPLADAHFVCCEQNDQSQGRYCWLSMHFNMITIPVKPLEEVERDTAHLCGKPGESAERLIGGRR